MKNNWKGRTGFKILALVAATLTGLATILGGIMMIVSIGLRSEYGNHTDDAMAQEMQEVMLAHYTAYLVENAKENDGTSWDALEGSSLSYAVEQITFNVSGQEETFHVDRQNAFIYGDEKLIQWLQEGNHKDASGVYQNVYCAENTYNYNIDSWRSMLTDVVYRHTNDSLEDELYLSENAGGDVLQYYSYDKDAEDEVEDIVTDDTSVSSTDLDAMSGSESNTDENAGNDANALIKGEIPPEGTYVFYRVYTIPDLAKAFQAASGTPSLTDEQMEMVKPDYKEVAVTAIGRLSNGQSIQSDMYLKNIPTLLSRLQKEADSVTFADGQSDYLWIPYVLTCILSTMQKIYLPVFLIALILFIISFVSLMTMSGHRREDDEIHLRLMDRIPYVIYGILAVLGVSFGVVGNVGVVALYYEGVLGETELITLSIVVACLWQLLALAFSMSTASRIKSGQFWKYTFLHYIAAFIRRWLLDPIKNIKRMIQENVKLSVRLAVGLLILGLVELFVLAAAGMMSPGFFIFFLYKIVETFVIYYFVFMAKKLKDGGKRVANGNYNEPIDTTHMIAPLREHGEDINHVGEGIAIAVAEQMKSERLKTELITNVSHDIKTPLTSIINYVDLIKKENVSDPTVREYVDVLDRQSARLKKLIEDLLEASKASTGNVEMHMEACDAAVMISQIVGEYQEKLQKKNIDIVVNESDVPANIMADGRHLWRVFDNIMTNICKYAQEHTRVYVDVTDAGDEVNMTFKNISKYPLNITSDELMERFVRGDASRNTEGHGLGLSIAQSLTELMGGQLSIAIDGDLFKITVTMKKQA